MTIKPKYLIDSVSVPWFVTTFHNLSDSIGTTMDELRSETAQQGVDLGVRSDMVTRLLDLEMVEMHDSAYKLTTRGKALQDTLVRDRALFLEYLHQWHYVRAMLTGAREYFTTYRLLIDAYWNNPDCDQGQALSQVIKGVTEAFPAAMNQTGLSKATVGKGLSLWKEICGGSVVRRTDAPVTALLHAVGLFGLARGFRPGEPVLLSDATRTELCLYLLLEPAALDPLIDRSLRLTKKLGDKTSLYGRSLFLQEPMIT